MNPPRILIACVGHLFMGDDAFGCEVANRLAHRSLPEGVRVVDFGIRSLDLTYAMLENYDGIILVDAAPRGGLPGTLYVIEPHSSGSPNVMLDGHTMDPVKVLEAVAGLGGRIDHVMLVGCEPTPQSADADWQMALSDPVQRAVEEAISLIESLVEKIAAHHCPSGGAILGGNNHEPANSRV